MNLIVSILGLSLLVLIMTESVALYRATICRQEAWLLGTVLKTKTLLSSPKKFENTFHPRCQLNVIRNDQNVFWQKMNHLSIHKFDFEMQGKL